MLYQVWDPDLKGVTWLRELSLVGVHASWAEQALVPLLFCPLGTGSSGHWPAQAGRVWGTAGRVGSVLMPLPLCVPESPPGSSCLGFPPSPGWGPIAPSSFCGFLILNGRGLRRLQWAVECEPGWGHWRWVESRDGWL